MNSTKRRWLSWTGGLGVVGVAWRAADVCIVWLTWYCDGPSQLLPGFANAQYSVRRRVTHHQQFLTMMDEIIRLSVAQWSAWMLHRTTATSFCASSYFVILREAQNPSRSSR